MKKLLATSALVGTLAFVSATPSVAQTSITGSLDLTMRATKYDLAAQSNKSDTSMGRESQINVQNKGTLNNGLGYAAGFSLEFDGGATVNSAETVGSTSNENLFIDLIAGSTTFTFGIDHIQNPKNDLLNATADIIDEQIVNNGSIMNYSGGGNAKESMGLGIVQNLGTGINASVWYAPNSTNKGTQNNGAAVVNGSDTATGNSIYEIGLVANDINKSGVSLQAWRSSQAKGNAETSDTEATSYAIDYKYGQFGVGAARIVNTSSADIDTKITLAHLSYAPSANLSASLVYGKTNADNLLVDEKLKGIQIGYNLGAVGVGLTYSKISDLGGVATNGDVDALGLSLSTKF
jgi:hypothetical protein